MHLHELRAQFFNALADDAVNRYKAFAMTKTGTPGVVSKDRSAIIEQQILE